MLHNTMVEGSITIYILNKYNISITYVCHQNNVSKIPRFLVNVSD